MKFSKKGNVYTITRITGSQDTILDITFAENFDGQTRSSNNIEVIEWTFSTSNKNNIKTSKQEVMEQVLEGLNSVNLSLGANYRLAKIYFSPFDSSANQIYLGLIT